MVTHREKRRKSLFCTSGKYILGNVSRVYRTRALKCAGYEGKTKRAFLVESIQQLIVLRGIYDASFL